MSFEISAYGKVFAYGQTYDESQFMQDQTFQLKPVSEPGKFYEFGALKPEVLNLSVDDMLFMERSEKDELGRRKFTVVKFIKAEQTILGGFNVLMIAVYLSGDKKVHKLANFFFRP